MMADVSAPPPPAVIRATSTRGVWGPLLAAMITEVLILVCAALWLTSRPSASPPINPAWGPMQLDITKPATPELAPAMPPLPANPAESEQAPRDNPPPEEAPPQDTPDMAPQTPPEETTSPAISRALPDDPAPMPLPDMSLLPRDDTAPVGPRQPAPRNANGQTDKLSQFLQELNVALRDASHYPDSARGMRLSGRVSIVVHYRDGKAWGPRIVQSSGFPALDQAVIEGVTRAIWPPPPPGFEGREIDVPIMGSFW
jgi:periplasmic protein TonB